MALNDLKETRAGKLSEMRTINEKALHDQRDLSGEERKRFDALDGEIRSLTDQIERSEKVAAFERVQDAQPITGDMPELRSYSLSKAISEGSNGRLTGLEAETHQELSKGREVRGVMIPTEVILGGEQRAVLTTQPAAGPGGNLVATDLAAMTDRRRPALKIEQMGATILRGLNGNLDLPRLAKSGSANWVSEHTDSTRSDPEFAKKSMGPKTVTAEYELSRRMMLQSNQAIDTILRSDLAMLLSEKMDAAAIRGGTTPDEPVGIIADPDVQQVAVGGTDLGNDTSLLMQALEVDDVTGTRAFLSHPIIEHQARTQRDAEARPFNQDFIWHGQRHEMSSQMPTDLGAGNDEAGLIYGEWASLYLGFWSGVDILLNPYHADVASKGGTLIHAFLDVDVIVRHPEGFRYMSRAV